MLVLAFISVFWEDPRGGAVAHVLLVEMKDDGSS